MDSVHKMEYNIEKNMEQINYIEEPWTTIESYFKNCHLQQLVRHQLESYNDFVNFQIIKTIDMFNPVIIKSENDYDEKSDVFSLGIILFELFHPAFTTNMERLIKLRKLHEQQIDEEFMKKHSNYYNFKDFTKILNSVKYKSEEKYWHKFNNMVQLKYIQKLSIQKLKLDTTIQNQFNEWNI